ASGRAISGRQYTCDDKLSVRTLLACFVFNRGMMVWTKDSTPESCVPCAKIFLACLGNLRNLWGRCPAKPTGATFCAAPWPPQPFLWLREREPSHLNLASLR